VNAFTVSADGFGAGPDQGRDQPLGRGGEQLHQWFLPTRIFQQNVLRREGGTTGVDNDFAARSFENLGAWIMGRNMFGPYADPGRTISGRAGGAPIHRTMCRSSS
jgi:dihydrofolate reductase